jgi:hypothetical protein
MFIQYCSDLHLEKLFYIPRIHPIAKILLLGGDIGHPRSQIYAEFIRQTAQDFEHILLVDGNHEFERYLPARDRKFPPNVTLLQNSRFYFEEKNVYCLGTTLWTPSANPQENRRAIQFLEDFSSPTCIVLTHHVPSRQLMHVKYRKFKNLDRFYNDLDYILYDPKSAPGFWIAGHSHCKIEKRIGHTLCLINTFPFRVSTQFQTDHKKKLKK